MSNAIYPTIRGLTYNVVRSAEFSTIVQSSPSGAETRISQFQNPLWHYELIYDYIKDYDFDLLPGFTYSDYKTLLGFYLARQGQFDSFLLRDPIDNFVGPALLPASGNPNLQAQLQVVSADEITFYSPIQRLVGGQFYEDITDLGPGSISVYANGAAQAATTNYTIGGPGLAIPGFSFEGLYLQWVTLPAAPVTAQFNYYFRVRFEQDRVDFEEFLNNLWTLGGSGASKGTALQLVTARP